MSDPDPMHLIQARELCDGLTAPLNKVLDLLAKGDPNRERPELPNRVEQLLSDLETLDLEFQG